MKQSKDQIEMKHELALPSQVPKGYTVHSFPDASAFPAAARETTMQEMNQIIASNWVLVEPHWTTASSPFRRDFGLIFAKIEEKLVAFCVYRNLVLSGQPALYRSGTEVHPAHQGQGLYGHFTSTILSIAKQTNKATDIIYGWRTRNPIIWSVNAKLCTDIALSIINRRKNEELTDIAIRLGGIVHPGIQLERPSMIMRNVYTHIKHKPQAYYGEPTALQALMTDLIPDHTDALFSVGRVRL